MDGRQPERDSRGEGALGEGPLGEGTPVAPVTVSTLTIIRCGLALWAVALVVTLLVPALHSGSRQWWPWACVVGLVLGCVGAVYVRGGRGNAREAR